MPPIRHKRSGIAAIVVMVATSIIMSIVASAMVATIRSNRERKVERQQIQLRFVNEAGAIRMLRKLKDDPNFVGDECALSIDPQTELSATIRSSIREDQNGRKKIEVIAILDNLNPHHRMQFTKTYPLPASKE